MIEYKIDILKQLSEIGYTQYRLRKDNELSEGALIRLRKKDPITFSTLDKICTLLKCQPGDILAWTDNGQSN